MAKKVLLYTRPITPPWDEASKNLAYEIACAASKNYEIHILTTKDALASKENRLSSNVRCEPIFKTAKLDLSGKLSLMKRLWRININADIIHFLFTPRNLTSLLIKFRLAFTKAKTIQTIATINDALYCNPRKLQKVLFADCIVAQSKYTQKKLRQIGLTKTTLIYPGIDLNKFKPTDKNPALMKELGLKENETVFLFAGEFTRIQGIDDIIAAFNLVKNEFSPSVPYKLIVACRIKSSLDKQKRQKLQETVTELKLADNIIFHDTVKDMPTLYNVSDVQIFTVREMTGKVDIPFALIEPMACKKPIIVSDIPVLKELANQGEVGIIVKKANPLALAECIKELLENKEKHLELGEKAFSYVKENFDILKNVKSYEKLYNEL